MNEAVRITGIDMSIGQMAVLFLKIAIASIPAMILLGLLYLAIVTLLTFAFWPAMSSG